MMTKAEARELYQLMKEVKTSQVPGHLGYLPYPSFPSLAPPIMFLDWVVNGGRTAREIRTIFSPEPWVPPPDQMLLAALHFACLVVAKYHTVGGIYIADLDDSVRSVDRLMPAWFKWGGIKEIPMHGFDILPGTELALTQLAASDGRAAKEITERLAKNILMGAPMNEGARFLAHNLMVGILVTPPAPKREPTQRQRDTLLVAIADGIRDRTPFTGSANQAKFARGESTPICGCTIAAAALRSFDIHVDAIRASKIYSKKRGLPLAQLKMNSFFGIPDPRLVSAITGTPQKHLDVTEQVVSAVEYFS